jgi:hypothetical protein
MVAGLVTKATQLLFAVLCQIQNACMSSQQKPCLHNTAKLQLAQLPILLSLPKSLTSKLGTTALATVTHAQLSKWPKMGYPKVC